MTVPGGASPLLLSSTAAAGGYAISRSVRFNSSDSAYLSRAVTASNRKKWSFSFWFKKTTNSQTNHYILDSSAWTTLTFNNNALGLYDAGAGAYLRLSAQVFRDPSAWYYILVVYDSDNATAQNRLRFYCNGAEITTWQANTTITSGYETRINGTYTHTIGTALGFPAGTINGYLADIHFIDGQALDPTSFGEFDANGIWQPIDYSGSFGTNGFHLPFDDNSTAAALGYDAAGSNDWTVNNISVTAGAGNDSLVDVPTNGTETDTGAGGEVRGNYATLNPIDPTTVSLSNGNLDCNLNNAATHVRSTFKINSGKWYWEITPTVLTANMLIGVCLPTQVFNGDLNTSTAWTYADSGQKFSNGSGSAYGSSYTVSDVIGVAFDSDAGTLVFYKNGVSQGTAFTGLTSEYFPAVSDRSSGSASSFVANFGQRPFAYTAPSGFKALNTANLPAPLVTKPSEVMDVKLYTGNGSTQNITGLGFSPDFVWIKSRSFAESHRLLDTVRTATKTLYSDLTIAEGTDSTGLTAFNSDGFTLGSSTAYNQSSSTYVAWAWDAGSSTVTNTQGSISSQVRANASAGFSVVTYTGTGVNATVGHGLGVAPTFMIVKRRSTADDWAVYHSVIGATKFLYLNLTNAADTASTRWQDTAPTSTVFSIGTSGQVNGSSSTYVAYCFAPVDGYGNGFSYTGNGNADGPFQYLGFLPKLILIKCSSTTGNWVLLDTEREGYNVDNDPLFPNLSNAEGTTDLLDITSNGFKLRSTNADVNANAATYVGYAWAESPFQFSRAR